MNAVTKNTDHRERSNFLPPDLVSDTDRNKCWGDSE